MAAKVEPQYFVEAASKLLDVLESFSSQDEELSITDVARRAGLTYSSAFRLLFTLQKRGYVMRAAGKKRYRLAPTRRRFRIGFAGLQASRFQREVGWSLVAAAAKAAVVLLTRINDQFNVSKAILNADRLLAEKVDLLIEYQFNQTAGQVVAAKCNESGIPCISVNFALPGAYYFGGNNYATGVLAGQFLSQFIRNHWKNRVVTCIVLQAKGLPATQEARIAGLRDTLRESVPNMRNSDVVIAAPTLSTKEAYEVTRQLIKQRRASGDCMAVMAVTDPLGIGAEKAARDTGLEDKVVIIGHGGARDARRLIQRGGPFRASVAFFPDSYGETILALALRILMGEKVPLATYANHAVLTGKNLHEYYPAENRVPVSVPAPTSDYSPLE